MIRSVPNDADDEGKPHHAEVGICMDFDEMAALPNHLPLLPSPHTNKRLPLDAVRQAISELGKDASPIKIQEFVKSKFKMDMTTAHVSNYKTTVVREKGKKQ